MKKFNYYLYDNYENTQVLSFYDDPRNFLNSQADFVINTIFHIPIGECNYNRLCELHSSQFIDALLRGGLIKKKGDVIFLDCTIIFQEDLHILKSISQKSILQMVKKLEKYKSELYTIADKFDNGFDAKTNLYHILCGYIFDGLFFDYLSNKEIVSTSKIHESKLDYLIIGYEKTNELDTFSKHLLCSYNRFTDKNRALQSFGDADGNRKDFFRFSNQIAHNTVPCDLVEIEQIWHKSIVKDGNSIIFNEIENIINGNECNPLYKKLLTEFGYMENNKINVPVYNKKHIDLINNIENIVEIALYDEMSNALSEISLKSKLICCKHNVNFKEIANELYHIIFGQLNEELVRSKFVSEPIYYESQGRCLKSIVLM